MSSSSRLISLSSCTKRVSWAWNTSITNNRVLQVQSFGSSSRILGSNRAPAISGTDGASSSPVAFITGGCSGMGLAVAKDLAAKNWNLAILDLNKDSIASVQKDFDPDRTILIPANVTDYESQASAFSQTWDKFQRLDFVFSNAGIGDRMDFYGEAQDFLPNGAPAKPNELVIDVCLNAMVYTSYLALHYFRQNASKGGKIVFTSSLCGLYPGATVPLYTAAKHGVVGLTRALSRGTTLRGEPITVNCVCPGLVDTGLSQVLMGVVPQEFLTPKSTIVTAVNQFVDDNSLNGQVAECSGENIHRRTQPEFGDEGAKYIMTNIMEGAVKEQDIKLTR